MVCFDYLNKIHVPDWSVTLFGLEIEKSNIRISQDELISMYGS